MGTEIIRILINLLIIAMLFWMIFFDSEPNNPIKKYWMPKVQSIFVWFGLSHEWRMFSPDPFRQTMWPKVKMILANDDFFVWEPTFTKELSVLEKVKYKKFHKFYHDVGRAKAAFHTKIDFIEYLLHKYALKETCVKVEIYRVTQAIPPFDEQTDQLPPIYQQLVYTYHPKTESKA